MIKRIVVDRRIFYPLIDPITSHLNIVDDECIKEIICSLLPDYNGIYNLNFWDIIHSFLPEKQTNNLDYNFIEHILDIVMEVIQKDLDFMFNISPDMTYSFSRWIGDDVMLELHDERY